MKAAGRTFRMTFRRCSVSVSSSIEAHDFVVTMLPPPADAASRSMRCKHSMQLLSVDKEETFAGSISSAFKSLRCEYPTVEL